MLGCEIEERVFGIGIAAMSIDAAVTVMKIAVDWDVIINDAAFAWVLMMIGTDHHVLVIDRAPVMVSIGCRCLRVMMLMNNHIGLLWVNIIFTLLHDLGSHLYLLRWSRSVILLPFMAGILLSSIVGRMKSGIQGGCRLSSTWRNCRRLGLNLKNKDTEKQVNESLITIAYLDWFLIGV